jgi:hypothetical protein
MGLDLEGEAEAGEWKKIWVRVGENGTRWSGLTCAGGVRIME